MPSFVHLIGSAVLLVVAASPAPAQKRVLTPAQRAEVQRLERQLAALQTNLASANAEYDRVLVQLATSLDRINRIRTVADLTATAASLGQNLGSLRTSGSLAQLNRNLRNDLVGDALGVTSPSFWASVGETVYNRLRNGQATTARAQIQQTISQVQAARFQTGVGYVRQIQQTLAKLRALRGY